MAFTSINIRRGLAVVRSNDVSSGAMARTSRWPGLDRTLEDGTGSYQANAEYFGVRSLNGSSNQDLDLYGSLTDPFGTTLNFTKVKAIWFYNLAGQTNAFRVGPASSNGFSGPWVDVSDRIAVMPGSCFQLEALDAGWTVTSGTGDKLNVANQHTSAQTYWIHILGTV